MSILSGLYIGDAGEKGRGVFTRVAIPANTIIEVSPVIILSPEDRIRIEETSLYFYIFEWGEQVDHGAVGLGYISIYNHASPSNCEYLMDYEEKTITVQTMRKILPGEELLINYSAGWDDWQPLWFEDKS